MSYNIIVSNFKAYVERFWFALRETITERAFGTNWKKGMVTESSGISLFHAVKELFKSSQTTCI